MEVQLAWLEPVADAADVEPRDAEPVPTRKRPPRLPGAAQTLPPMPLPSPQRSPEKRHRTIEVEMSWIELVDEAKRSATPPSGDDAGRKRPSTQPKRAASVPPAGSPERPKRKKPIPRED